jgi:hypothetical protein
MSEHAASHCDHSPRTRSVAAAVAGRTARNVRRNARIGALRDRCCAEFYCLRCMGFTA